MEVTDEQRNKTHKSRVTGNKAVRRDDIRKKKAGIDLEPNRGKNPKAFMGLSAGSHKSKQALISIERKENILHLPSEDKTFSHLMQEPPLLVLVVGPPGCGKTTLIRSLVKFYANRNIRNLRGPVTIIAGRARRVTFVECPNTLSAMCDMAKVADLVLLMVDGSFGFEMETFEFLNIAQVHGFPRVIGVVSHLDKLKTNKSLKKTKKFLRHRFWHEVANGAKMLCLAPIMHGMYRQADVLKLHRLLLSVEPRVQSWRNTHSCIFSDRHEDLTNPDDVAADPTMSRTVAFFGYVRGKPLKPSQAIHIPGLGDFDVAHVSNQDDPCPPADMRKTTSQGHKMRHLSAKQKKIYAPYCDIGGLSFDEDAVYMEEDADRQNIERSGEGLSMLRSMQRVEPVDAAVKGDMAVVRRPVKFLDGEDNFEIDVADHAEEFPANRHNDDSDDDDDDDEDVFDDLGGAAVKAMGSRRNTTENDLEEFFKDEGLNESDGGEFDDMPDAVPAGGGGSAFELAPRMPDAPDATRINTAANDWTSTELLAKVKAMFVTGKWTKAEGGMGGDDEGAEDDDASSKGYQSTDEEFEAAARGEITLPREADDDDDVSADDDDDTPDDAQGKKFKKLSKKKKKGLAGVAGGSKFYDSAADEAGGAGGNDDDDDDYNILEEGPPLDNDLQGLVDHFIGHQLSKGSSGSAAKRNLSGGGGLGISTASGGGGGGDALGDGGAEGDEEGFISRFDPGERERRRRAKNSKKNGNDEEDDFNGDGGDGEGAAPGGELSEEQAALLKKKMAKKKAFDESYDVDGGKNQSTGYYHHLKNQSDEKKSELDKAIKMMGDDIERKISLVGFFSGLYVRVVIKNVPVEFVDRFDPSAPVILGGLNPGEDQMQIVNAKLKRHRWYPRILKAQDPLLLSIGWRRLQTQPIYAQEDPSSRLRYLKYTPQHMHCYASFYAPVCPTNTGFIAIPVTEKKAPYFRPMATGYTVGNDEVTGVTKKLKLTGTPQKIQKTTCFVKGMFNSDIEAAKFVGAKVKSVSGLRGIVKAAIKGKYGVVRCTFEDKLLASDIVFIRAWKPVDPPRFCSFAPTLISPDWQGMKTMAELRRSRGIKLEQNPDSEYKEIKRRRVVDEDEPLRIAMSRNLKMNLPYDMKEEYIPLGQSKELQERVVAATTIAPEPREVKKTALLDVFQDKADKMEAQRKDVRRAQRTKKARDTERDEEEYKRKLKKAKKETAKKTEFRSQHKSRNKPAKPPQ